MKTKRIKSFLIAAVIAFESIAMGWVPANAQTVSVSENAVAEQEVADVTENVTEESAVNAGKETSANSENITAETGVAAYASGTDGALTWTLDADGHLTITGTGNYADRANIQTEGWLAHASKIKSATVDVDGISDTSYMFYNCTNLESIDLSGLDTSDVTTMCSMFCGCKKLTALDLSKFTTGNVWDMSFMFFNCSGLSALDFTTFTTNTVTTMKSMFNGCYGLRSLDLSGFNTANVEDMSAMFQGCSGLKKLKLNGDDSVLLFNTSAVTDMSGVFADCSSLETLNLSGFNTSVLNMETEFLNTIFLSCSNLTRLIVSEEFSTPIPVPQYEDSNYSYDWIYGPTGEAVSEITSAGTYIRADIYDGTPITYSGTDGDLYWEIDENGHLLIMGEGDYAPRTDTSKTGWLKYNTEIITATVEVDGITKTNSMFQSCENLASVDLENLDTSAVTDMHNMFDSCANLAYADVSGFDTAKVENMSYMFNGCFVLEELDVSGFDTTNVTNMDHMFTACRLLTELDVTGFDTKKVTCMDYMFAACDDLESLDISSFSVGQLDFSASYMLADCTNLTIVIAPEDQSTKNIELPVGNMVWRYEPTGETVTLITKAGTYMRTDKYEEEMFVDGATEGKISWELNKNGHLLITGEGDYDQHGWLEHEDKIKGATVNVTGITNTSCMFIGCSNLESLDVSGFVTDEVQDMSSMFESCSSLTGLDMSGLNTGKVEDMSSMFYGCSSLTDLNLRGLDTGNVKNMCGMFAACSSLDSLDLSGWDTGNVTDMSCMFDGCSGLTGLNMGELDTGNVTDMSSMFYGCSSLTGLDVSGLDTDSVTDMPSMFEGCSSLTSLDLNGFETSNVTSMAYMLSDCTNLTTLKAPEIPSSVELKLPVTNHIWIYEKTGTSVTKVMGAGTYTRKDNLGEPVTPKEEPKATVETTVKTGSDGSVTTTVKTTEPNGEITLKIVSTSKDEKKETIVDMTISASGQLKDAAVEVANVTKTSKMTINLNELKDLVDQVTLCNTEYVYPVGSKPYVPQKVDSLGDIYRKAQEAIGVAQKKANVAIKVSAKSPSGQKKYSVAIKKTDLTKKKFVVYGSDKKGNAVMVNTKKNKATVNKKKDLTLKVAKKGDYQLQNTKDAKKTNKKIMKTVKPKKSSVTVKKGKSTSFKLSSKCNKDNISKIKYSSDNSKVKVSKKGKISAKGSGTAKVTATVTMKNGQKKKIKVKVKVS